MRILETLIGLCVKKALSIEPLRDQANRSGVFEYCLDATPKV